MKDRSNLKLDILREYARVNVTNKEFYISIDISDVPPSIIQSGSFDDILDVLVAYKALEKLAEIDQELGLYK